jgi:hypothetical protein
MTVIAVTVISFTPVILIRKAVNSNVIVFVLTRPGLKLINYHIQDKYANHYTTYAVSWTLGGGKGYGG